MNHAKDIADDAPPGLTFWEQYFVEPFSQQSCRISAEYLQTHPYSTFIFVLTESEIESPSPCKASCHCPTRCVACSCAANKPASSSWTCFAALAFSLLIRVICSNQ